MMLAISVTSLLRARGISNKYSFFTSLGMSYRVARRLANGEMRTIKADHVEKICIALRCTPNDLLHWTPESFVAKDHPLQQLNRRHEEELINEIKKLPLEKLAVLKEKLEELDADTSA